MIFAILSAVLVAGLVGTLAGEKLGRPGLEMVCKPLASTAFIAAALHMGALDSPYGVGVLIGLSLSWVGDVALIAKGAGAGFLVGLVAFLSGHVAYCVAFGLRGLDPIWTAVGFGCLVVPIVVVGRWLLPCVEGRMKGPVVAYMTVISVMVALAVGTVGTTPAGASPAWPLLAAAVLFYISDLFVARERFVTKGFINRAIGLPVYYGAQLLFAWTVGHYA